MTLEQAIEVLHLVNSKFYNHTEQKCAGQRKSGPGDHKGPDTEESYHWRQLPFS